MDSKEPQWDKFQDFLKGEVRYASVMKQYPNEAAELFQAAQDNAKWRYNNYKRLAKQQWGVEVEDWFSSMLYWKRESIMFSLFIFGNKFIWVLYKDDSV